MYDDLKPIKKYIRIWVCRYLYWGSDSKFFFSSFCETKWGWRGDGGDRFPDLGTCIDCFSCVGVI